MARLQGKIALVSGGARGIGAAAARAMVAEGGKYLVRTNLTTRGFRGWAVYAGTRRDRAIQQDELKVAELARENTEIGVDANSSAGRP